MIIVGLGNPGKKYNNTRHNIGFEILDQIKETDNFPDFKLSKKFKALISEKDKIILVKPQTFMNLSGKSVKIIASFYKTKDLIVIHDDIDLVIGKIKISRNKGSAGHKGIESIIKEIGKDFTRIRIGIQPKKGKPADTESFVLKKFKKQELEEIKKSLANQPSFY